MAAGAVLELRAGLYEGPFVLPADVTLEGRGAVVLHADGPADVVLRGPRLTVKGVSIQGGAVGIRGDEALTVERVHFSGHREAAVEAAGPMKVSVTGSTFKGLTSNSNGLVVNGATLELSETKFTGAYRRAVEVSGGGSVTARQVTSEGPKTLVHVADGTADLRDVTARRGAASAFFVGHGSLRIERGRVEGHEYGVQTAPGAQLVVDALVVNDSLEGALSLVGAKALVSKLEVRHSGPSGAVQSLGASLELRDTTLTDVSSLGVLVRKGTFTADGLTVEGVRAEPDGAGGRALGDAVHIRDAEATLKRVTVKDTEGSALFVGAGAHVKVEQLRTDRSAQGAVVVERGSTLEAKDVKVAGSLAPGVTLTEGAQGQVDDLTVTGADTPWWAECDHGTHLTVSHVEPATLSRASPSPCVEVKK